MSSSSSTNPKCNYEPCNNLVSLVGQNMPCRCRLIFCDKHRNPEKHKCTFDEFQDQQAKLRRENPQVNVPRGAYGSSSVNSSLIQDEGKWIQEFWKQHQPRAQWPSPLYGISHSIGFIVFLYFVVVRGLVFGLLFNFTSLLPEGNLLQSMGIISAASGSESYESYDNSNALPMPGDNNNNLNRGKSSIPSPINTVFQELVYGIIFGFISTHVLPYLYLTYVEKLPINQSHLIKPCLGGQCRFCLFSWDTVNIFSNPKCVLFALKSEYELLKDHILFYIITNRGTNCLSHLYHGGSAGSEKRSTMNIYETVTKRLGELSRGARCM